MQHTQQMSITLNRNWLAAILLSTILFLVYSNSFHCSWQFDDRPNIIDKTDIHIPNLTWQALSNIIFADNNHKKILSRPFSYLTLGLNWYFGEKDVFGYHLVNFGIHTVTAILVFLTILKLLQTPNLQISDSKKAYFIALLSATIWAIHPIQVQAVTFIVQRMTSLAAMFTLLAIFLYLKARLSHHRTRIICYLLVFISFIFAVASKENTVLLPVVLLLIEWTFFNTFKKQLSTKTISLTFVLFLCLVGLIGVFLFGKGDIFFFLNGYENRGFSLSERLLTESRIVVFYLSQIFYPITARFSITHDIQLSKSLIHPWTTIPAILIILSLLILSFTQLRKRPWLGFPILFYFLYHLIESTVVPLELIFEHRNYLPTVFLFLPLSISFYKLLIYYKNKKVMYFTLNSFLCILIVAIGLGTYSRNLDWKTQKTLWQDAMKKAPNMARPVQNLANFYYRQGKYKLSIELNKKVLDLYSPNKPIFTKHLSYLNLASNYLTIGAYEKAVQCLKKAIKIRPTNLTRYHLSIALMCIENFQRAEKEIEILISSSPQPKFINFQSLLAFKMNKSNLIQKNCQKILKKKPGNIKALYYLGLLYMQQAKYYKANYFLNTALRLSPKDIGIYFSRIENNKRAGNKIKTQPIVKALLSQYSLPSIFHRLDKICNDPLTPPISKEIVLSALNKQMKSYVER